MRGPSPRRRGGPLLPLDEGREAGILAAEIIPVSARCLSALSQLRGSFGTRDAASPAPPGSVPKVGCPVCDRAKIHRPKRRGLRGHMVPPSNRARPAVRCRTAFPQKCRDGGPGGASSLPVGHSSSIPLALFSWTARRPVLFSRGKREWGAESASPWGRKKRGLWPHRKVRAALRRKERGGEAAPFFWVQHILAPAGILSSSMTRWSFSSPFSVWTAEMSIPQLSWPIIFRGGRLTMASRVLPTSSSGS